MTEDFWRIRSKKYDKLYWVNNTSYIDKIINMSNFNKDDLVLDVGTGTGIIAENIKSYVNHVIGLDKSKDMLNKRKVENCSFVNWDIGKKLFIDNIFDKITARMVFHHILKDLDGVFRECFNLLKQDGLLIVAEGIPPSDDPEIVEWFRDMFKYKEERKTFTKDDLIKYFINAGFVDIKHHSFKIKDFNINNWLNNSGVEQKNIDIILDLHYNANPKIKKEYNMKINGSNCIIESKHIIITGKKG